MRTLFIIRGLPGSGKSTLAAMLTPYICEADQYFTHSDGTYEFDASKLSDAHGYCLARCDMFMNEDFSKIAVSNTSSRRWEFEKYIELAKQYNYQVIEITLTGEIHGNAHNVPEATIELMKARWEK